MKFLKSFQPRPALTEQEVSHGLRMMTWEGMVSMGYSSITTSGFLAAYALALGADNLHIGILAALPFIMQLLQIPSIYLVEKLRRRKVITIISWFLAQLLWFPIALIPLFVPVPGSGAIATLLALVGIRGVLSAATNCAWNSWVRDLVPQSILGRFYSRRLSLATAVAAVFGLIAAFFVDYWKGHAAPENTVYGYTMMLFFGALFLGILSPMFMSRMPEPAMPSVTGKGFSLWQTLLLPLKDKNFRHLMLFLLSWGFALNLATPFFAVYMLERLHLSLSIVIGLSVLSQIANILFLKVWGNLTDRFGSKVILSLCSSLFLLVILGWTFTNMSGRLFYILPLLTVLHVFAGIAGAGIALTIGTFGMKLAPQGQSTPYLTGASLANNLGAGLGPLVGGFLAKFFSDHTITLDLTWAGPSSTVRLGVYSLTGFDFLFFIAFILGLITMNLLTGIREQGEVKREVVLGELLSQTRTSSHGVGSSPLLGLANVFPLVYLQKVPGFDVAIGVTAYQLAETARRITLEAARSRNFSKQISRALERGLFKVWKDSNDISAQTMDMAEQAARGAMQAAVESEIDTITLIRPTVTGIINSMVRTKADPEDTIRGVSRGIIRVGNESGVALGVLVKETVESVRDAAAKFGLDEREAALEAAEAALATVHDIDPAAEERIREFLSHELRSDLIIPKPEGHKKPTPADGAEADPGL